MEVKQKVYAIIVDRMGISESEIADDKVFADLGADSLDAVELIMEFEKAFEVNIPDDEMEKLKTVGDVIAYIEQKLKK